MPLLKTRGFTLVELMIGLAISTLVFGAMICALSSIEKCFLASNQYAQANADQQRVMDYIGRDLRGAYTISISSSTPESITMTVPDYYGGQYDAQGNPTGAPATPSITTGTSNPINYGNSSQPLTIMYYMSGADLIRQQTVGVTGSTSRLVISSDVDNLKAGYVDLTSTIQFSVTFMPIYQWVLTSSGTGASQQNAQTGTTLTAVVSVRNTRRD